MLVAFLFVFSVFEKKYTGSNIVQFGLNTDPSVFTITAENVGQAFVARTPGEATGEIYNTFTYYFMN